MESEVFLPSKDSAPEGKTVEVALVVGVREDMLSLSRTFKTIQVFLKQ